MLCDWDYISFSIFLGELCWIGENPDRELQDILKIIAVLVVVVNSCMVVVIYRGNNCTLYL